MAPLWFADQAYHAPDRAAYMAALAGHRPRLATVLDLEREEQLPAVLDWAEEAAQHAGRVAIIPKCYGIIPALPRRIGSADIVLGYSVPSSYGGTAVPCWEFAGWPVHLLGGSPRAQMWTWRHLAGMCDVASADGNYAQRLATHQCQTWVPGTAHGAKNRWAPTLAELDGRRWPGDNAPAEAFRRSCAAIMAAWRALTAVPA